jgi:UDP-N-acetylglucosamine--N-acetylmuramyl-(pentapeptide) pyrophosphoryl-undecaprenol N-acetylglucosamine transferase
VKRVALFVSHLMGSGHLVRVLAIARALQAAGAAPTVISGGRPLPHLDRGDVPLVQLPPLTIRGTDYRTLLTPDGTVADADYRAARRDALRTALVGTQPDALVCELWPFGRRMLTDDFLAACNAVPGRPVFSAVRDVIEPPTLPERVAETVAHLDRFVLAMVHSDPAILPLATSWPALCPMPASVTGKIAYTGYVTSPPPEPIPCPDTVMVAVGSGMIGRPLLRLAAQAAALSPLRWHLLVGGTDAADACAALRGIGPAVVEPNRADYRARLGGAAASVSLAGYNTILEVLQAGTPSLIVPMEEGGEREQAIRMVAFATQPGLRVATMAGLTPQGLADLAGALAAQPRLGPPAIRMDGAAEAARMILDRI